MRLDLRVDLPRGDVSRFNPPQGDPFASRTRIRALLAYLESEGGSIVEEIDIGDDGIEHIRLEHPLPTTAPVWPSCRLRETPRISLESLSAPLLSISAPTLPLVP